MSINSSDIYKLAVATEQARKDAAEKGLNMLATRLYKRGEEFVVISEAMKELEKRQGV